MGEGSNLVWDPIQGKFVPLSQLMLGVQGQSSTQTNPALNTPAPQQSTFSTTSTEQQTQPPSYVPSGTFGAEAINSLADKFTQTQADIFRMNSNLMANGPTQQARTAGQLGVLNDMNQMDSSSILQEIDPEVSSGGDGSNISSKFKFTGQQGSQMGTMLLQGVQGFFGSKNMNQNGYYNAGMNFAKQIANANPYARLAVEAVDTIDKIAPIKGPEFKTNQGLVARQGSAYKNAVNAFNEAEEAANKDYGIFSGLLTGDLGKAKKKVAKANELNYKVGAVDNKAQDWLALSNEQSNKIGREVQLIGGNEPFGIGAKNGAKLPTLKDMQRAKRISSSARYWVGGPVGDSEVKGTPTKTRKPQQKQKVTEVVQETQSFKEGGNIFFELKEVVNIPPEYLESTLVEVSAEDILPQFKEGGSFNVIPEGALHARRHNMDIEGITKKGIPVVSEGEGGEIEQQAEIEREEIIFRLEVTKQLEDLKKKFESDEYTQREKDEFAIEAGKLLTHEIINNTIDHTNNLL